MTYGNEPNGRRNAATERKAYEWARDQQDYTGTYQEWQSMPADERQQYEDGAAGIGTV